MSRGPSGTSQVDNPGYNTGEELELSGGQTEVIDELRRSLGAIPEVAQLYGTVEAFLYNNADLYSGTQEAEDESSEISEDELSKDSSAEVRAYATTVVPTQTAYLSANPTPYLSTNTDYRPSLLDESDEDDSFSGDDPELMEAAQEFHKHRVTTDTRLAKMAQFLPDKSRSALNDKFREAVKLGGDDTIEGYEAGTKALTKFNETLDAKRPALREAESVHLRKRVKNSLDNNSDLLGAKDSKEFTKRFTPLDAELSGEENKAEKQLKELQKLSGEIGQAINAKIKAISDLNIDYERLAPIVERAVGIKGDKQKEVVKAKKEIDEGFSGKFAKEGLSLDDIKGKLDKLNTLVGEVFKNFTVKDAVEQQKKSLPASPDSLQPKGNALGKGAFGEVYELANDGDKALVGKSFNADDKKARADMEHEAEIYARLGDHPNIAKCYGIHEVDDIFDPKPMLVMDKIEGKDVDKVFDDLDKRYRTGKLSREEYLGSIQHIMKGTLMGLAHMESMGLVHKDIKGDNIKFDTRTNEPILIDMGLAQAEGAHKKNIAFFLLAPPENAALKSGDKVVTTIWDSFSVGTMLFTEMEREQSGKKHVHMVGGEAVEQPDDVNQLASKYQEFRGAAQRSVQRTDSGEFEATHDSEGNLIGQALKPGRDADEAGGVGRYGAATEYVDFMNKLTHPDPKLRLSPSEALKHPFLAQSLLAKEDVDRVFKAQAAEQSAAVDLDEESEVDSWLDDSDLSDSDSDSGIDAADFLAGQVFYPPAEGEEAQEGDSSSEDSLSDLRESGVVGEQVLYNTESAEQGSEESPYNTESGLYAVPDLQGGVSGEEARPLYNTGDVDEDESGEADTAASSLYAVPDLVGGESDTKSDVSSEESTTDSTSQTTKSTQPAEDVEAKLKEKTTALQRWKIAERQIEQQFNSAYSGVGTDKAKLKAAGFTKGKKFSGYFTYNKDLPKLIEALEKAKAKKSKDVPKLQTKVTAATAHYRDKILRKATEDFGWAIAKPAVTPPFWKTMVAALDDVDEWVAN